MDKYRIDTHKMAYHPKRVADWVDARGDWEKEKNIFPIYVEISPTGVCNHRCTFCSFDYREYQNKRINPSVLMSRIAGMASVGVKAIMFAGEGEPTLYKDLPQVLNLCSAVGIDTSLTTNMVPFNEKNTENFVKNCKWIKASINAGTKETYAKTHGTSEKDFAKVIGNLKRAVAIKKEKGYKCTIGTQILLLPDNYDTVEELAKIVKEAGAEYLVIKPYTQHFDSPNMRYKDVDYSKLVKIKESLEKYNSDNFSIIFRINAMNKLIEKEERYCVCNSVPFFWAYITSDGDVYGCSSFLGDKRFNLGNIHEEGFRDIWQGEKRRKCIKFVRGGLDISDCRMICRMDEVNKYLNELTHLSDHVNFI